METINSMTLNPAQQKDLISWAKDYGEESAAGRQRYLKVDKYKSRFLIKEKISSGTPFNCYHEGVDRYRRKDGNPLTEEDITAIYEGSRGQGSKVVGKAGDLEVTHEWFIDSGD